MHQVLLQSIETPMADFFGHSKFLIQYVQSTGFSRERFNDWIIGCFVDAYYTTTSYYISYNDGMDDT